MLIQELLTLGLMAKKERVLGKGVKSRLGKKLMVGGSRIKSISSVANDSTYFFPVVASEYLSTDEAVMIVRALERAYAVFARTAFSLIPAVEIESFDDATVKDYLRQFHTNMGLKPNARLSLELNESVSDTNGFRMSILNEKADIRDDAAFGSDRLGKGSYRVFQTQKDTKGKNGDDLTDLRRAMGGSGGGKSLFVDQDWRKANDLLPTTMNVPVKFMTTSGHSHITEIMVNIKATLHKASSPELIRDIANSSNQGKGFLKFVKWISREQKSTMDFLFGISQMKFDIRNKRANPWVEAFKRRRRLADLAWGTLENNFKPIATICLTMNEVNMLKTKFDVDVFKEAKKIMKAYYLLGFVIVDQVNEIVHVMYDSQPGFQEYPYKTLEREAANQDRTIKDMVKAMGAMR